MISKGALPPFTPDRGHRPLHPNRWSKALWALVGIINGQGALAMLAKALSRYAFLEVGPRAMNRAGNSHLR